MLKFASAQILDAHVGGQRLPKTAHRHHFDYEVKPGYLYVRSRAISSRCNDNWDEFPADEIAKAYRTFVGKPVFVNHANENHRTARGLVIDAALHRDRSPDGTPDVWVEVLMEIDAVTFPKLAQAILDKKIERTSMGCDVAYSICSVCGNRATTPAEYCQHIPRAKGQRYYRHTVSGRRIGELIREVCHGLRFFENSVLVEPPADPTAHFLGVDASGLGKKASRRRDAASGEARCKHCQVPVIYTWKDKWEHRLPDGNGGWGFFGGDHAPEPHDGRTPEQDLDAQAAGLAHAISGDPKVDEAPGRSDSPKPYDHALGPGRHAPFLPPEMTMPHMSSQVQTGERGEGKEASKIAAQAGGLSWNEVGARHPHIYGDPEIHGEAAEHADGEMIGWAANNLAHSTPDDPDAERHSVDELTFHRAMVDPHTIDHKRHGGPSDGRVASAIEGYKHNPEQMPPLVLVHRHGVFQVADGHHRAEAAKAVGMKKVPAYVAKSPYPNKPDGWGAKGPFHGAEKVRWTPPKTSRKPTPAPTSGPGWEQQRLFEAGRRVADPSLIDAEGLVAVAYGEIKAPQDVDTLREEQCPVCGDKDVYDGEQCRMCGFISPPHQFRDPDLDMAKRLDLRKQVADPSLIDNNGELERVDGGDGMPGQDDPMNPTDPTDPLAAPGQPLDPDSIGPDGQLMDNSQQALDGEQVNGKPQATDVNGDGMIDPSEIGPDGEIVAPEQGGQAGPRELPWGAQDHTGQPFFPGPDMPDRPEEPEGPQGVLPDEDILGQPGVPGEPVPGTPGDGVPDLMCPTCGFEADASMPTSQNMDNPMAADNGIVAGDVCPNCGKGQLLTPGELMGADSAPPAVMPGIRG